MTMKFKPTFTDKLKIMNKDMITAREVKKKEIVEKYIPDTVKGVLTPEEVDRSATWGIFAGLAVLLIVIVGLVWWFLR